MFNFNSPLKSDESREVTSTRNMGKRKVFGGTVLKYIIQGMNKPTG